MTDQLLKAFEEITGTANRLVAGVADTAWANATPCSEWNTRQLVNHMAFTSALLEASARRQVPTVDPEQDLLGDDPVDNFSAQIQSTYAAWSAAGALDGDVSVPFEMPAPAALGIAVLDLGVHCWDLAQATGQDHGLGDSTVEIIDEWNHRLVTDEVRAGGGFAAALDGPGDQLGDMLAFVGRRG